MRRDLKAYIEAELRDFPRTKAELAELRDNLLNESPAPPDGVRRGNQVSNPTLKTVTRLMTDRRINHLQMIVDAIEYVTDGLLEDRLKLIELKYWQRPRQLTDAGIAMELNIEVRTLYRWTDAICTAIGMELGLMHKGCHKDVSFRGR